MGIGASTSVSTSVQQAENQLTQEIVQTCNAVCNNDISGVVIEAGNIEGDIIFDQACTTTAQCQMQTIADSLARTMFDTVQQTQAERDFTLLGAQINVAVSKSVQDISQEVFQQLQATCNVTSSNLAQNIKIAAKNTISGDIRFNQTGGATASCIMTAGAKAASDVSGTVRQTTIAGQSTTTLILIIALIIAIIIIIILASSSARNARRAREAQAQAAE
jgi:hypothetical protein